MSSMGLRDVEKIERFYLNSCTDIPLHFAKSLHQSFPALNESTYSRDYQSVNSSKISRSQSGRSFNTKSPESDATLHNMNRAKRAFFKICDSLISGNKSKSVQQNETPPTKSYITPGSCHLIMNPSMSKTEFIQKLEEGIVRNTDSKENTMVLENPNGNTLLLENQKENTVLLDNSMENTGMLDNPEDQIIQGDHHQTTQSDYVLAKPTAGVDETIVINTQNSSKSTTAIAKDKNEKQKKVVPLRRSGTTSKVIITGILLLVFFGFLKNASSNGG